MSEQLRLVVPDATMRRLLALRTLAGLDLRPRGASRARGVLVAAAGGGMVAPPVEVARRAVRRLACAGRAVVAELVITSARARGRGGMRALHELAITPAGGRTERDLAALLAALREEMGIAEEAAALPDRILALAAAVGTARTAGGAAALRDPLPLFPRLKRPGLRPTATMAEAARRILAVHFGRMLDHEAGTRLGRDPEELHDMRVATRRMRAALRLLSPHLEPGAVRALRRGLRRVGRALGAVRDLDVLGEKTVAYLAGLPEERRGELSPLVEHLEHARTRARGALLAQLDGAVYRDLCRRFARFLAAAGAAPPAGRGGEPLPQQVRHVVPAELYRLYGEVLAFAAPLAAPDPPLQRYHLLRIAAKRLRYALEFFSEVLGDAGPGLIDDMKALQDHLGSLQDAVVASTLLSDFLRTGSWGGDLTRRASAPIQVAPGVAAYLAARQEELRALLEGFPPVWERVRGAAFGARLGAVATALAISGPRPRAGGARAARP